MTAHICAWCKSGLGSSLEEVLENQTRALIGEEVSHGICEDCERKVEARVEAFKQQISLTREHVEFLLKVKEN